MQSVAVCVYRLWPIVQSAFPPNLRLLVSFLWGHLIHAGILVLLAARVRSCLGNKRSCAAGTSCMVCRRQHSIARLSTQIYPSALVNDLSLFQPVSTSTFVRWGSIDVNWTCLNFRLYDLKQRRPISAKIPGELGRWGPADGKPHGIGCLILDGAQHMAAFVKVEQTEMGYVSAVMVTVPCLLRVGWYV